MDFDKILVMPEPHRVESCEICIACFRLFTPPSDDDDTKVTARFRILSVQGCLRKTVTLRHCLAGTPGVQQSRCFTTDLFLQPGIFRRRCRCLSLGILTVRPLKWDHGDEISIDFLYKYIDFVEKPKPSKKIDRRSPTTIYLS